MTIFAKHIILDAWEGSKYASGLRIFLTKKFSLILKSYMEVKVKEKWSTIKFQFVCLNVPDNKFHKQKWHVLFFACIKLVVCVLVCACAIACIKWRRLNVSLLRKNYFSFLYYVLVSWFSGKFGNCIVKNEKWIVFPESWYVNLNPAFNSYRVYLCSL